MRSRLAPDAATPLAGLDRTVFQQMTENEITDHDIAAMNEGVAQAIARLDCSAGQEAFLPLASRPAVAIATLVADQAAVA